MTDETILIKLIFYPYSNFSCFTISLNILMNVSTSSLESFFLKYPTLVKTVTAPFFILSMLLFDTIRFNSSLYNSPMVIFEPYFYY